MFRMMLVLFVALSLGGCIDNEPPLAEECRLLLSG